MYIGFFSRVNGDCVVCLLYVCVYTWSLNPVLCLPAMLCGGLIDCIS